MFIYFLHCFAYFRYKNVALKESRLGKSHAQHVWTSYFFEIFWPTSTHLEQSNGNSFFDFLVGTLRGVDPSKKMRIVRTIHFHPFSHRELRHAPETCFSVVEMRLRLGSEVETWEHCSQLQQGLSREDPCPNGRPSSDCPVGWHTDDATWRHRVRSPASGVCASRLPKTRECVSPCPQGLFPPPK